MVKKIKALIHSAVPQHHHRVPIDQHVVMTLSMGEVEDLRIQTVVQYYWGLRIFAYAYAFAGIEEAPSHNHSGTSVVNAPLDVNLDYADDALRLATTLSSQPAAALAWLEDRDVQTRGTMVGLIRQGWPQGEALLEARREHSLDWYNGPMQRGPSQAVPPPPQPYQQTEKVPGGAKGQGKGRGKRTREAPSAFAKRNAEGKGRACPDFNKGGCTTKQKQCPHKLQHFCTATRPDGKQCGNRGHSAKNHRH